MIYLMIVSLKETLKAWSKWKRSWVILQSTMHPGKDNRSAVSRDNAHYPHVGLFKMYSRWIWGVFNIQNQSDRGHKLMLFMLQNKD